MKFLYQSSNLEKQKNGITTTYVLNNLSFKLPDNG